MEKLNKIVTSIKTKFELYQDNSGGWYMIILGDGDSVLGIYDNWEYHPGELRKALEALAEDPDVWQGWAPCRENDRASISIIEDGVETNEICIEKEGEWVPVAEWEKDLYETLVDWIADGGTELVADNDGVYTNSEYVLGELGVNFDDDDE